MKTELLDQTFRTADNRLLFVYFDSFIPDRMEIRLGNIGRFEHFDEDQCRDQFSHLIKALSAKQVNSYGSGVTANEDGYFTN